MDLAPIVAKNRGAIEPCYNMVSIAAQRLASSLFWTSPIRGRRSGPGVGHFLGGQVRELAPTGLEDSAQASSNSPPILPGCGKGGPKFGLHAFLSLPQPAWSPSAEAFLKRDPLADGDAPIFSGTHSLVTIFCVHSPPTFTSVTALGNKCRCEPVVHYEVIAK